MSSTGHESDAASQLGWTRRWNCARLVVGLLLALFLSTSHATAAFECRIQGEVASKGSWDSFVAGGARIPRVRFDLRYHGVSGVGAGADRCREALEQLSKPRGGRIRVTIDDPRPGYEVPPLGQCIVLVWSYIDADNETFQGFAPLEDPCAHVTR